mmetsp:Transcript_51757/g.77228  ORF Transcript_51757/g.77228 Transcript_51757/m.77228 type:complete len:264 (+) Transcript_51757:363-1154(+)
MHTVDTEPHGKFACILDWWIVKEIISKQGLFGRPPIVRIQDHHIVDQVDRMLRHPTRVRQVRFESLSNNARTWFLSFFRAKILPELALFVHIGPKLLRRVATGPKDEVQLRGLVGATQETRSTKHFCNDTPNAPHINLGVVLMSTEQQLGRTIPQRDDSVCETLHVAVPATSQTPIGNLELASAVHKQVAGLQVAVDHLVSVHIVTTTKQLLRPRLYVILAQTNFGRFQNASQIILQIFKHHEHILGYVAALFYPEQRQRERS